MVNGPNLSIAAHLVVLVSINGFPHRGSPPSEGEVSAIIRHGSKLLRTAIIRSGIIGAALLSEMELHVIHGDLPRGSVIAVLVLVLLGLHSANNGNTVTLLEILIDKHTGLAPSGTLDKVALLLAVFTCSAVNGNRKAANLYTASGRAKFGVFGQATSNDNLVNKSFLLKCL